VNISIYDLGGQLVKTLVNSKQSSGNSSIQWNSTNNDELPVSAGLYFYTIQAGDFRQTKKMVLLK
jgi:flagellar hook assembly protein FlgD